MPGTRILPPPPPPRTPLCRLAGSFARNVRAAETTPRVRRKNRRVVFAPRHGDDVGLRLVVRAQTLSLSPHALYWTAVLNVVFAFPVSKKRPIILFRYYKLLKLCKNDEHFENKNVFSVKYDLSASIPYRESIRISKITNSFRRATAGIAVPVHG